MVPLGKEGERARPAPVRCRASGAPQRDDIASWPGGHELLDVARPSLQGSGLLGLEFMPLIHPDDPAERATHMVQNLLDGRKSNPKSRHTRRGRPAKVMQAPWRDLNIIPPRLA